MKARAASLFTITLLAFIAFFQGARMIPPKPPVAKKVPTVAQGSVPPLADEYAWLRDDERSNPEVLKHLKAENAYSDAVTEPLSRMRETLYHEMRGRIQEDDTQVPYKLGARFYYSRTEKDKQYPIRCRKTGSLETQEEVILDENKISEGKEFFDLGDFAVSIDGQQLAYTSDTLGYRQYNLHVKDLNKNTTLENIAERVTSVAWAADHNTLFYVAEDAVTKRSFQLFRHRLGSNTHELLYTEADEFYGIEISRTRSNAFLCLLSQSKTTTEVHYLPADRPQDSFKVLLSRREGHEYYVDHRGADFFIRTNDLGKSFRLVKAPVQDPSPEKWSEIIPCRPDVTLEDADCFTSHLVCLQRDAGLPQLSVHNLDTGSEKKVAFPEPVYSVRQGQNPEFYTTSFRFLYQSFTTPDSVFDYNMDTGTRELKKQEAVLGGYDPARYESQRLYATAIDGTKIPISILSKGPLSGQGPQPLLLEAYGAYGIPSDVEFSSDRLSLLERGVVYAIAHVRGGGDLGKDWHDQGKMMAKKNTFSDFIACAEHLIAQQTTSSQKLAITGGSAGGLLLGAVTNMRPDLFKLVVSYVPFVDVLNTMLDETLPLTVGEYLEWGNPHDPSAFEYMRSYSPYDNIKRAAYPTMLVRSSLFDSQVGYWEPAKYVAKLRELKTDTNPLLFKISLEPSGHGGASGRFDRLHETAFDYAFILRELGLAR
jgi:oligopeptidase B